MPKKSREFLKFFILSERDGGFDYKIVTEDGMEILSGWAAGTKAQIQKKLAKDVKKMNERMAGEIYKRLYQKGLAFSEKGLVFSERGPQNVT